MSSTDEQLARGWKLHQAGDLGEAERIYRDVLAAEPGNANAWCFWGMACHDTQRFPQALEAYTRALELNPKFPIALNNRGNTLRSLGRIDDSIVSFQAALEIQPEYVSAHHNQSLSLLLGGYWDRGFDAYEWRWRYLGLTEPSFSQPRWDGSPLNGRRILLHAEQGLGDTLQFARFVRTVRERGGRVQLVAQAALIPILRSLEDVERLTPQGGDYREFDTHAPLMSLPRILGVRLNNLLRDVPYLHADSQLVELWAREFAGLPGMRIGLAWQGNPANPADNHRSPPLAVLETLLNFPDVHWVSLQKGPGVEQLRQRPATPAILDWSGRMDEQHGAFMDTAAILKNLDLVITSDSAIAHLAGALGVPVWVMLPFAPDWRWLLHREDSPWYPNMRLFRQPAPGDWPEVVRALRTALESRWRDRHHRRGGFAERRILATGFNGLNRSQHGPMIYNRRDMYIGRSIDRYGGFSESEVELFQQILKAGDLVVEAGANIGAHTIPMAKHVGARGQVWAFEPQRIVFQTLCGNVAINSLGNVITRQAALGESPGSLMVPALDYNAENNFGGLGLGAYQQGESVPVETIDRLGLPKLNLLKVDVEGMETQVLRGAVQTLAAHRPILYVENDRTDRSAELIGFLQSIGYRMYWHLPPMFRRDNYFGNANNVFGSVVSINMLCVHSSVPASIQGLRAVTGPEDRP